MVCVWQVKLSDPIVTRAISGRFRDKGLIIKRYMNLSVCYRIVQVTDAHCWRSVC